MICVDLTTIQLQNGNEKLYKLIQNVLNKFQEWYTKVFGGIDDPRIKYLTALEKPWHDVNCAVNKGKWVPCDQLIMAAYLDDSCITSRESYWVCVVPIFRT